MRRTFSSIGRRLDQLESTIGRERTLDEMSDDELEAIIRQATGCGELTDELLQRIASESEE